MIVCAVVLSVLTACGGSSEEDAAADDSETLAVEASTTSSKPTTTRPPSTMAPPTTEAVEPVPVAPLTGLPLDGEIKLSRPAFAVKIDNHQLARPQIALDAADLVFDLRAEGVTRFMAVFHSQVPDTVGPVRSSRTSDFDLLRGLDHPVYASSGGNPTVMGGVAGIPVHALTNQTRTEYFRQPGRPAPHNLVVHPQDLLALVPAETPEPKPWFAYRAAGDELSDLAEAVEETVTIDFTNTPTVTFDWDGGAEGWLRSQDGAAHVTDAGDRVAPANVVIMVTTYGQSAADATSPEVHSTGTGELIVLTAGHKVAGTWSRPSATDKPQLLDGNGTEISLTPGQTWVLYPEAGQVSF